MRISLYKYYTRTIIHIIVRGPLYIATGRYIYVYDMYVHVYESRASGQKRVCCIHFHTYIYSYSYIQQRASYIFILICTRTIIYSKGPYFILYIVRGLTLTGCMRIHVTNKHTNKHYKQMLQTNVTNKRYKQTLQKKGNNSPRGSLFGWFPIDEPGRETPSEKQPQLFHKIGFVLKRSLRPGSSPWGRVFVRSTCYEQVLQTNVTNQC